MSDRLMSGGRATIAISALLLSASGIDGCASDPAPRDPRAAAQDTRPEAPAPPAGEWTNSIGMRFRFVPPGDLILEAPLEGSLDRSSIRERFLRKARGEPPLPPPIRRPARVTRPFAIGICEVTQAEFEKVMGRIPDRREELERPAAVSWEEAAEFCRRLSALPEEKSAGREYRLPTQAEWVLAGVEECSPWRLSDRHTSVWNWCLDLHDPEYYQSLPEDAPTPDPMGAGKGDSHVVMLASSHPDPFRHLITFHVAAVSGLPRGPTQGDSR